MSKYVLTQKHLDQLQQQIRRLTKLNDAKEERIRELELHKVRVSNTEIADLIRTIGSLESEVSALKKTNQTLANEINSGTANSEKLRIMLEEEQKLRKYSELFAKEVEIKCAEESLIRELTSELCQLQRAEIDIDNKRIQELQNKLNKFTDETGHPRVYETKEIKQIVNIQNKEKLLRTKQLKFIIEQLRTQLFQLHNVVENIPDKTAEDHKHLKEIEKWLRDINLITEDINSVEDLRKGLKYMRQEIENKKKSVLPKTKLETQNIS